MLGTGLSPGDVLLETRDVAIAFRGPDGRAVQALDGVSVSLRSGHVVGLVGESGSGKSTLVRALLGLVTPSAGDVRFRGRNVATLRGTDDRAFRRAVQVVFQDPALSLNARHAVRTILGQPLWVHHRLGGRAAEARLVSLLHEVGLDRDALDRPPAAFSGGQRQRIAIARALTVQPSLLLLDEPLSALDPATADGVLALLERLRHERNMGYLLVSHDLEPVARLAETILVLRAGRVVEAGPTLSVLQQPDHPYTQALVASAPSYAGVIRRHGSCEALRRSS